jgi:chromate transport protein ChrA
MLFSLLALTIAIVSTYIHRQFRDNITRLLITLIGLFSLLVSLVVSPWFIKLLILWMVFVTPVYARPYPREQTCSSPVWILRSHHFD